jgi:uncharacterized protein (TIGR03118 family)
MKAYPFATAALAVCGLLASLSTLTGCGGGNGNTPQTPAGSTIFQMTKLVSDLPGVASVTDPNLVNPWGIAFSPTSPFWIADNGTHKSTLYNGAGAIQSLVVGIPAPTGAAAGDPTGQVFNGTTDFNLPNGSPALFIFATEDGTIVGWNAASGTNGAIVADRSAVPAAGSGAVYKGLAIASNASGNFLYATNFRAGTIDVFDKNFGIMLLAGSFADPNMPAGYAPFGIQNIGGDIYVTYAKQDAAKHDDVGGAGSGLIDVFDANGNLKRRLASGTAAGGTLAVLNSPWGMALAPANFGAFSNALLVGNFGDGHINAFNLTTGAPLGQLQDPSGATPIVVPGLWGLAFGNGGAAGTPNVLFFTAGIGSGPTFQNNIETHGLFGSLQLVSQ